jgi:hypothetical protein
MSAEENERKLLNDYLDAASDAEDPQDLAQRIAIYEKQLLYCKNQAFDFDFAWLESMVYYFKARHKLLNKDFVEKTLRSTVQQSSGFDGIAPALLAKGKEESRIRDAISLLGQAIKLSDDPDYRFFRATLYQAMKYKESALADVEHLLKNYSDDKEIYLAARKLKDEIETSKDKCFIATAVYAPYENEKIYILRQYRDKVLLKTTVGKAFVLFYYAISPKIAGVIAKSNLLKTAIRFFLLDPIVRILQK